MGFVDHANSSIVWSAINLVHKIVISAEVDSSPSMDNAPLAIFRKILLAAWIATLSQMGERLLARVALKATN